MNPAFSDFGQQVVFPKTIQVSFDFCETDGCLKIGRLRRTERRIMMIPRRGITGSLLLAVP